MQEQVLINEIVENPELESPRLILADWLEERGDLRSTFLRLQCEFMKFEFDHEDAAGLKTNLLQIWASLDCPDWLDQVGIKYNVWLHLDSSNHRTDESLGKIAVVKMIRLIAHIGLREALQRSAGEGPSRVLWDLNLPKSDVILQRLAPGGKLHKVSKFVTIRPSWQEPLRTKRR